MLLASLLNKYKLLDYVINYVKWIGINSFDFMAINNPLKGIICTILAAILHIKTTDASFADIPTSLIAFSITLLIGTIIVWIIVYMKNKDWSSIRKNKTNYFNN